MRKVYCDLCGKDCTDQTGLSKFVLEGKELDTCSECDWKIRTSIANTIKKIKEDYEKAREDTKKES